MISGSIASCEDERIQVLMKSKSTTDGLELFKKTPFSTLVKDNSALAALRHHHASMPARERRMAADWEYNSEMATEIFNHSMAMSGKEGLPKEFRKSGDTIPIKGIDRLIICIVSPDYPNPERAYSGRKARPCPECMRRLQCDKSFRN